MAQACGWHKAKTSRIEHAHTAPSADDVRMWCRVCGADEQADDLIASLRAVEGMWVEWRRMERAGLRHAQDAVRPLYERTTRFRAYSSGIIPGMIQTREYTAQVLRAIQRWRNLPDDVEEALESRMDRQGLIGLAGKSFAFLLEESALRATVVEPAVMVEQIEHLVAVASLPTVSVGIVPAVAGRRHWPVEDFWIFDTAQVSVELVSGYLTVTQPREVAMYARTFTAMAELAVFGADARALMADAIRAVTHESRPAHP